MRRSHCLLAALAIFAAADALAGTLVITPSTVSFGDVPVAGGPVSSTVTIRNMGPSQTTITGFTMASGCQAFTATSSQVPTTIPNGQSITVTVTFDPISRTSASCNVTVVDNNGVTDQFNLNGDGLAPELQLMPTLLTFADQPWASGTGETLNVMVTNVGELPIAAANLTALATSGTHFSVGAAQGLPIENGESAIIPVTFNPTSVGFKNDNLTVSLDNDAPGAANPTVLLSGTGTAENTDVDGSGAAQVGITAGPSPTTGTLFLRYGVAHAGLVTLEVCDLSGRVVARVQSYEATAGSRSLTLRNATDWSPATGVYFVRASLDGREFGRHRVLVLR